MAHINVLVDDQKDTFKIQLDSPQNGFYELDIDGHTQSGSEYSQAAPGPLQFVAKATNLGLDNPDLVMHLQSRDGKKTYVCAIAYTGDRADQQVNGVMATFDRILLNSQPGPIEFSQGNLTGVFSNQ